MKLIFFCLVISTIYGDVHSQHNQSGLIEILESNKFVLINFLETDLIDEELFTLTFTEVAEQIKIDYKEEKGLVSLVQINCKLHTTLCDEQLRITIFPAVAFFNYGEFGEYRGKLEKEALLQFISDKVGAPIKSIPKTSKIDITIKYFFNGLYSNGLVNFIRAFDLMKQHCKMQLVNTKENHKSSMVALVTPHLSRNVDPLYIEPPSLNTFNLEEVMRFVQLTLNADYKTQGNQLLAYEKIQVNISFPLNNTIPQTNFTGVRIPNLKQYKLKTIVLSEDDFFNLLLSDTNLDSAWNQIKTYHSVNQPKYPSNDQNPAEQPNYSNPMNPNQYPNVMENQPNYAPPIYLQPPMYSNPKYPNQPPNNDQSNVLITDWFPALTGVLNRTLFGIQPDINKQYVPLPFNNNYPPNDEQHQSSPNTYHISHHEDPNPNQGYNYKPPTNYDYPINTEIPYNYNYPMNNGQYQSGAGYHGHNHVQSQPMNGENHISSYNHGTYPSAYPDKNGNTYQQYYSNHHWTNSKNNLQSKGSQTIRNRRRGYY